MLGGQNMRRLFCLVFSLLFLFAIPLSGFAASDGEEEKDIRTKVILHEVGLEVSVPSDWYYAVLDSGNKPYADPALLNMYDVRNVEDLQTRVGDPTKFILGGYDQYGDYFLATITYINYPLLENYGDFKNISDSQLEAILPIISSALNSYGIDLYVDPSIYKANNQTYIFLYGEYYGDEVAQLCTIEAGGNLYAISYTNSSGYLIDDDFEYLAEIADSISYGLTFFQKLGVWLWVIVGGIVLIIALVIVIIVLRSKKRKKLAASQDVAEAPLPESSQTPVSPSATPAQPVSTETSAQPIPTEAGTVEEIAAAPSPEPAAAPAPEDAEDSATAEQPHQKHFCSYCGAAIKPGAHFCGACGKPID